MFEPLKKMLSGTGGKATARVPQGERVYVIGDIHGRLDLYATLIKAIDRDDAKSGEADTTVVLLGDLIDRGPDSAGVIRATRKWAKARRVRMLAGNHEEMFLEAFSKRETLRQYIRHGGRDTLLSYGIAPRDYDAASLEELRDLMDAHVPGKDRRFLAKMEDIAVIGDYVFVHAGIDPDLPLDRQTPRETRWIREPFLTSRRRHSHMVVHGHTIVDDIEERPNRIGIDTGAYRNGRLTALVLEGKTRRYLQAVEKKDGTLHIERKGDGA